jgi:hypothetical protein
MIDPRQTMVDAFADDVATSNIPSRTTTLRIGLPPFLSMTIAPFAVYGCDVEHIGDEVIRLGLCHAVDVAAKLEGAANAADGAAL